MADKPQCKLTGTDGNVFSVIGKVCGVLRKAGQFDEARSFANKATQCKSYDEVLCLCFDYVDVE